MTTFPDDEIHLAPPLEFKFAGTEAEAGILTGYASTWGGPPDPYGDLVDRGAFTKSLAERWPVMLFTHAQNDPIGKWNEVVEDSRGLRVVGKLNLDTNRGREVHAMLKHGDVGGLSIGFGVPPGGRVRNSDGTATLKSANLFEISVVAIPANSGARITSVKSFGSRSELKAILRESLPSRAVDKLLSGGWPAVSGDDGTEPNTDITELADLLKAARLDLKGYSDGHR